jgi:ubiquitin carboxyl-terminal hydrolase 34
MHSYTRQKLYNVVTILCQQNDLTYGRILELLDTIVPRGRTPPLISSAY